MEIRVSYEERAGLLKALAHPLRLRIIHSLLQSGCRNVSCMEQHTGVSQSCISQHLQKLRAAGLVAAERSGRNPVDGGKHSGVSESTGFSGGSGVSGVHQPVCPPVKESTVCIWKEG